MKCAHRFISNKCKNSQKCLEEGTEKCFVEYPPRMTGDEFEAAQTELLKDIPEEFHGPLSYMAYEMGHSAGHEEVINYLRSFVGDLKAPIKQFEKRLMLDKS
jgi:hypothetical protein